MRTINRIISGMVAGLMVALVGIVILGRPLQAEVPELLNYQGKLTDSDGDPVADGEYKMQFSLYDAESVGTLVWGPEIWSSGVGTEDVTVTGGLFNVLLGTHIPLSPAAFDAPYWIEV